LNARVGVAVIGDVLDCGSGFYELGVPPAFDDVEPWKIKGALPYVEIWRRDQADDGFYCRISGEQVNYIPGRNLSGKAVDEVLALQMAAEARARRRPLILPPAPSRNDQGGAAGVTDAGQPRLRLTSPIDASKLAGIGIGERLDYHADPGRRRSAATP
jgi:hypothetical protein